MLESVTAEAVCQNEIGEAGNTSENGVSVRRRLVAARPGILDCGIRHRRESMNRNFHHLIEEVPVDTHIKGRGLLSISHSEQHTPTFPMKVESAGEINYQCPALRRFSERFCSPDKAAKRHYRNINARHLSDYPPVGPRRINDNTA